MVSFAGSKKKNDDAEARTAGFYEGSSVSPSRISEADERTRLLPPLATGGRDVYLSPDDPAVSSCLSVLERYVATSPLLSYFCQC
jgi:hypothetical protein